MKTIKYGIVGAVALLFASAVHTFAIENIKLFLQCSNVVLYWPSVEGETYIVQYRPTLDPSTTWQTLASSLPADVGTNLTFFVHSNVVLNPKCNGNGGSFAMMSMGGGLTSRALAVSAETEIEEAPSGPLALSADGTGDAVPLAIYPPGFDLSSLTIIDPTSGESVSGAGYQIQSASLKSAKLGGAQPMSGGIGGFGDPTPQDGNEPVSAPDMGFYQVVRTGVHLFGLTNGMILSGVVNVPVEMGGSSTDAVAGVTFYANGTPLIGATGDNVNGNRWLMDWNTSMMPNGTYDITAQVNYNSDDSITSQPVTVTVNNVISFPNYFTRVYGDQMWIYAETIPNAAYQIDMYDENTNFLGSFADYADGGGYISFLWDLTDGNGYTFTSTNFSGVFTVDTSSLSSMSQSMGTNSINTSSPNIQTASATKKTLGSKFRANGASPNSPNGGSSSSASANQLWAKEYGWANCDNFVIAYGALDNNSTTTYKINEMVMQGVVNILWGADYTLSPGNVPLGDTAFRVYDGGTRTNLMNYLYDFSFRNFYWFGHGSPSAFAGVESNTKVTDLAVRRVLFNFLTSNKPANYHPYRFVFLDGCNTGAGSFSEAFGIPAQTVNNAFFAAAGVRSRAFLGFKSTISFNANQWEFRADMLGNFMGQWAANTPLNQCVANALQNTYQPLDSSWVIYGAVDLQRGTVP